MTTSTGPDTGTVTTGATTTDQGSATQSETEGTATATVTEGSTEAAGATTDSTTAESSKGNTDDSFFDPRSIQDQPELMKAYKQMQKAYTQKTQAIARDRDKIEAYNTITSNPQALVQHLRSMGYTVAEANAAASAAVQAEQSAPFQPQTWDEVKDWILQEAMHRMGSQMEPIVNNIRATTAKNIEAQLDSIDPNWRLYEEDMRQTLKTHPTLVKDVGRLYRMSVPDDVLHSRAVKEALQKHTQRVKSAEVHGSSTAKAAAPAPRKINNFQDAVEAAKEALRAQGVYK